MITPTVADVTSTDRINELANKILGKCEHFTVTGYYTGEPMEYYVNIETVEDNVRNWKVGNFERNSFVEALEYAAEVLTGQDTTEVEARTKTRSHTEAFPTYEELPDYVKEAIADSRMSERQTEYPSLWYKERAITWLAERIFGPAVSQKEYVK